METDREIPQRTRSSSAASAPGSVAQIGNRHAGRRRRKAQTPKGPVCDHPHWRACPDGYREKDLVGVI